MKTERNILIAFILNIFFSIFEFIGGIITGSVSIISDAVHDMGDAVSIGVSFLLEKLSRKQPDTNYSYGYLRYSVLGGLITTLILFFGSAAVIYNAILRILNPVQVNYNGMIIFAVVGVTVNFIAAMVTRDSDNINQKAVNLHMLEDVLGWIVVLIGALIMKFTDISIIDPIISIFVALFILVNSFKTLKEILDLFLEKTPHSVNIEEIKKHLLKIDGIIDVHHIHIWSMDGVNNYATMHIVTNENGHEIKHKVREELAKHSISHATLELEAEDEHCHEKDCHTDSEFSSGHHHHHHH